MGNFVVIVCLLFALITTGCARQEGAVIQRSGVQQDIAMVDETNQKMNAAMEKARKTVPLFLTAIQNPKPGQTFTVKIPVADGNHKEHMWLTDLTYDGKKLYGKLIDDPYEVKGYKMGQAVSVSPTGISDWMIVEGDKREGGFTEKVLDEMHVR